MGAPITLYLSPAQVYVFDAAGELLVAPADAEGADMARIDLDLAHAYKPNPQRDEDYALLPLKMTLCRRRRLCAARPLGLRQDDACSTSSRAWSRPSQGRVLFDGRDVTALTPQQRNIAQVFQFPVIYDTMTVAENLAFPLRNRGVAADRIKQRVGQIAEMLELSGQLDQRAAGLAADAKQKISLGRGLVREDVSAVLFDEPLTVIDPHLKWQLRRKLKQIHHELKLTLIYVTHDQVEALTFADQVVVMTRGRAVQIGSAAELFERPQHTFVGHFIGSPGMNFLPASGTADGIEVAGTAAARAAGCAGGDAQFQLGRAAGVRQPGRRKGRGRRAGQRDAGAGRRHLLAADGAGRRRHAGARASRQRAGDAQGRRRRSGCRSSASTPASTRNEELMRSAT